MRYLTLFTMLFLSGCKTAEFAITHPTTGVHLVARLEAREPEQPGVMPYTAHQWPVTLQQTSSAQAGPAQAGPAQAGPAQAGPAQASSVSQPSGTSQH